MSCHSRARTTSKPLRPLLLAKNRPNNELRKPEPTVNRFGGDTSHDDDGGDTPLYDDMKSEHIADDGDDNDDAGIDDGLDCLMASTTSSRNLPSTSSSARS